MGDRTLNDLYMLVGAVETSEGFLHSKEFADALLTQGRILRDCGHFELATILTTLAAEVLERPWRSAVSRRPDPTWGYAEQYPVWSLLMPSRAGDTGRPLDPIRALFLRQVWNAPGDIDVARARRLAKAIRPALRTLENPHTPEIRAKVLELQGAALQILRGTADGEFALRIIGELQNQDVLQQTPASELRQLFPRAPRLSKSPEASSTEERPAPTRTLREPSRGVFVGETRRDPTSTLDESDPPDTTVTLVQPELSGRVAGEIAVAGALRLMHLQLDEHSPERLHASEVKEIVAYLAGAAEAALDQHQIVKAEASLAWLLVALTTRALRHITRQRVGLQGDSEAIMVTPDFTSWSTHVPHADAFWTPKDLDSSFHLSAKTDIAVQLPIPERIRKLLCRSRDKRAAGDRLFRSGPAEIEAECDRFYRELRAGVGPRFSEKRLRLAVLIEMVASSGDPCLAQIIAGHRIDQSDAPLHYYSIPTSDIQRLYANSVTRNFGWEIAASATCSESRTGAPITALDRNVYRQFSTVLRREISETFGRARTSATWQVRCNAVTRYTAWLVAAAMAHRVTHWLSELTVMDIHPDGWAVIRDKNVSGAPHLRVVALPPSAMRQIGILRQTLIRAAESLLVTPDASAASCAKALRDSADGCAPLFVWVRPDHTVGSLDVERLRKFWLRENGLPGNFLRSRTRMLLTEQDVAPQWIYWQLGHVYLGRAPFGPECLHSISEFSAALNPALEVALATDGWNPAPTMMARQAIPPWPNPPFLDHDYARAMLEEIEALKAAWNAQHGMPLDENFNYPEDLAAECSAWAERALATLGPQQPERLNGAQHHVAESALNEVVAALLNSTSDRNKIDLSLRMLRSRLKLHFKSKRWSGTLPPRLFRPKFSAPSITKGHVRAARLSSTIREAALNASANSSVSVRDASLARLAILLISEGQARTANALHEILNPQTLSHGNPSVLDGRRLLLDADVADSRRRGFIFSPESTAAAERWLEVSNGDHPTLEVITRALRNYLPPTLIRSSGKNLLQRIIDVCTLGLVALLPGAALFRAAADDPLTISSERTGYLLRHQLHPLPILAAAADDESVAIRTSAGSLRGNVSAPAAIRQYRQLTRALYDLSERGDRQRIDHRRYTKARMAAQKLIDEPGCS
ncbi:MAG TPA: hypothetical protein VFM56_01175, partial [Solimonas sp.]|nr:hypothetical protein [Solimonas sp.]